MSTYEGIAVTFGMLMHWRLRTSYISLWRNRCGKLSKRTEKDHEDMKKKSKCCFDQIA